MYFSSHIPNGTVNNNSKGVLCGQAALPIAKIIYYLEITKLYIIILAFYSLNSYFSINT